MTLNASNRSAGPACLLARLLRDDRGQDLIEYALLGSVVALVGFLGMQAIAAAMGTVYVGWDAAVQDAWEVPNPATVPEP